MSIEAMKKMEEQLHYVLVCINLDKMPVDGDSFHEALSIGRKAIEEAEKQKPSAWLIPGTVTGDPDLAKSNVDKAVPLYTLPPKQEFNGLTEREKKIIMFALHRFMNDSYAQLDAASQDLKFRYFNLGDADSFYKDAKDAEALISKLKEIHT